MRHLFTLVLAIWLCLFGATALAQVTTSGTAIGGVAISTEGLLQFRQIAATRPTLSTSASDKSETVLISLPRALDLWKAARDAGQNPPEDVRYLKGLTQIQSIFVFPADHDIILAGSAEPIRADNPLEPVGTLTGRPVVQLEDLIVAFRAVAGVANGSGNGHKDFYGCSLDPAAESVQIWDDTLNKFGSGPRPKLLEELKKALGPQDVRLYGIPEDSRVALAMVCADFRLKRMCLGLESLPSGIGNALGTEPAMARLWFEPSYDPLQVSADGTSYALRGPRLKVLAGAHVFESGGAAPAQAKFAANLTAKLPEVAARIDAVADLQNVTDCFMVAALLRQDRIPEKAGIDFAWLMDPRYKVAALPVPRKAETIVRLNGNVIAQGGVAFALKNLTAVERAAADATSFATFRQRPADWFLSTKIK